VYEKLGIRGRLKLLLYALDRGLLVLMDPSASMRDAADAIGHRRARPDA
jgi:hypothetical protein